MCQIWHVNIPDCVCSSRPRSHFSGHSRAVTVQAQIRVLYPTSHQWLDARKLLWKRSTPRNRPTRPGNEHDTVTRHYLRGGKQTRTLLSSSSTYRWWYASKSFPVFQETRISDSVIVRPEDLDVGTIILWPLWTYVHVYISAGQCHVKMNLKLWGPLGP